MSGVAEVVVLSHPILGDQDIGLDIAAWEISHRITPRLVQQDDVLAVGDPLVSEAHPHAAARRLREQQTRWQRLIGEEVSHRPGRQWALLPCQTHGHILSAESLPKTPICSLASVHDNDHLAAGFSGFHHSVCFPNLIE
jgi:hypothetical protein